MRDQQARIRVPCGGHAHHPGHGLERTRPARVAQNGRRDRAGRRVRHAQQVMQSLAVERFAQATIVARGTPAGDPREMLGDRQLRHVRHDPRGQRDLAEGCRHPVLRVEPGERCACRGFPGVECRASLLQVGVQFARVLRQVRRERDAMNLARGQGGVEFSHVLAGAHCQQVRFAAGFRCPQLVDQCRRQRQRRRAGRQHVDAAREHGAGRRHAIEPRQRRVPRSRTSVRAFRFPSVRATVPRVRPRPAPPPSPTCAACRVRPAAHRAVRVRHRPCRAAQPATTAGSGAPAIRSRRARASGRRAAGAIRPGCRLAARPTVSAPGSRGLRRVPRAR